MAVVSGNSEKKGAMAEHEFSDDREEPNRHRPSREQPQAVSGSGFLSIYKPGQGYYTRMGTVLAAGTLIALTAYFLFTHLRVWLPPQTSILVPMGVTAGVVAALCVALYVVLNKPSVVDFLIATDNEMKKVNWATRKELWGSTRVVILFMFLIAVLLFVFDLLFASLFYWMRILQFHPFL